MKVKKLPATVKHWLEKQLDRKITQNEEISISVMKALTKKEREQYHEKWDKQKAQQKRRLNSVARKMLKAGMNKTDAATVRHGGWNT
ncbi:MAG: hypothetical protein HYZ63_01850 [Candidatus Andersenbacteria bacterium]|nr:hypothetical protein [Candidatus Andersenbacteria bacterium]